MKETVLCFVFLQLALVFGVPKSTQTNNVVPKDRVLQGAVEQLFIPDGNSIFEIDIVKGYSPEVVQHVRRKRQAEEPNAEGQSSSKKRRRKRKKKRRRTERPTTMREVTPTEKSMLPEVTEEQWNPPIENVVEPSQARKSRRFRSKPTEPSPNLPVPVLSEMGSNNDDTSGLLKVKSLESVYINTDNMKTNKLKADRIRADAIKAKDVVVTARKSGGRRRRTKRPKTAEFIEQGPIFEHVGTQQVNSILDQPQYATEQMVPQNPYGLGDTIYQPHETRKPRRRIRVNDRIMRKERTRSRSFQDPYAADSYIDVLPPMRPEVSNPEFISSRVRSKVPLMSEFIEGPSGLSKPSKSFINRRRSFGKERPVGEFHLFDSPIRSERRRPKALARRVDKTSKTFVKNVDPWFL